MGRQHKGYNWKARAQLNHPTEHTEDPNAEVIAKSRTKVKVPQIVNKKKLTARERKRLEKLLEAKEKKAKRASLLQELAAHQVSTHELELLQSSAKLGTAKTSAWETQSSGPTAAAAAAVSSFKPRRKRKKASKKKTGPRAKVAKVDSGEMEDSESEVEDGSSDEAQETGPRAEVAKVESGEMEDSESELQEDSSDEAQETEPRAKVAKVESGEIEDSESELQEGSGDEAQEGKCLEPAVFVQLQRDPAVQAARLQLPILAEEQEIMEAIHQNSVVILCGETGSGKTTQVPQFLYEAGFAKPTGTGQRRLIGITEPRRVAAVSMSKRVGQEMGLGESHVSYQIRYEGNTTDQTEMKFMTDGVLLKEVENDFLLTSYSAIIVDEAHERSVYTDILLGLLSRIVPLRAKRKNPLKLIIMSATLRVEDFTANRTLFPVTPPVIQVQSRQYPVTIHFNKRTPDDEEYVHEAFRKVCKLHRQLPAGGILVFVTGQQEVHWLCSKLKRTFPASMPENSLGEDAAIFGCKRARRKSPVRVNLDDFAAEPTFDDHECAEAIDDDFERADSGVEGSDDDLNDEEETTAGDRLLPMRVLPLFALLPPQRQAQVFEESPDGVRLCVVATNVAETSLTIPHIKYVVDTGKVKRRYYDKVTGVSSYRVEWTSQASANQRSGRAGRTGPGHCYRLYSSAVFSNKFEKFSTPEICRRPVDDLVLQMKTMYITKVDNFPFPTPPPAESMRAAEQLLIDLGALEIEKLSSGGKASVVSSLGRTMASFPVSPRYGKLLALGQQQDLLQYVVALVAAVSVQEVFLGQGAGNQGNEVDEKSLQRARRELVSRWGGTGSDILLGDIMVLLRAVCAAEYAGCTQRFCRENALRHKAVQEVRRLRRQLTSAVNTVSSSSQLVLNPQMPPPSPAQVVLLRQLVLSGLADHVARKISTDDLDAVDKKRLRFAYECNLVDDVVFLHPSSVLRQCCPEFVVFQEIVETSKPFMRCVVGIEAKWLARLAPQYCSLSDPLDIPPPCWDSSAGLVMCHRTVTFGRRCWSLPAQQLEHPAGLDKYKWFARFFLEGKVVLPLQQFVSHLLSKPSTVLKSWANLQARVQALLGELVDEDVSSHAALLAVWKKKPTYLLKAYLQWLPEAHHSSVQGSWPPAK